MARKETNFVTRERKPHVKLWTLVVLVIQNSSLVLMMRFSRVAKGNLYTSSTAVVLTEIVKIFASLLLLHREDKEAMWATLHSEFLQKSDLVRACVPAALYAIQNNILFLAVSNLDAATFQITYQLKILCTALFAWLLLGKKLNRTQTFSLFVLMAGVTLVQWRASDAASSKFSANQNPMLGLISVLMASMSSGFAGVYFEKSVKNSQNTSLWIRNAQLAVFSFFFASVAMLMSDGKFILERGFFFGYNGLTWLIIATQAVGGILVAMIMKYADNVSKCFATSVSIVISAIVSWALGDFTPSSNFLLGATLVIISVFAYSEILNKFLSVDPTNKKRIVIQP